MFAQREPDVAPEIVQVGDVVLDAVQLMQETRILPGLFDASNEISEGRVDSRQRFNRQRLVIVSRSTNE